MDKALHEYAQGARALILAAERLFGEHGLTGVSLRQILAAAGQANSSAVQHHFGSRDGLIRAVYQTREQLIEAERQHRLAALDDAGRASPESLLRAWLLPILETLSQDDRLAYARFMLRLLPLDESEHPYFHSRKAVPGSRELTQLIRACLPDLPAGVFAIRLRMVVGVFLEAVVNEPRSPSIGGAGYISAEMYWCDVLQMALALLTVPFPPAATLPQLRI